MDNESRLNFPTQRTRVRDEKAGEPFIIFKVYFRMDPERFSFPFLDHRSLQIAFPVRIVVAFENTIRIMSSCCSHFS